MKIKDYILKNKLTQSSFADMIGVHRGAVARYISGERKPRPELANDIVKLTKGHVTMEDIYAD